MVERSAKTPWLLLIVAVFGDEYHGRMVHRHLDRTVHALQKTGFQFGTRNNGEKHPTLWPNYSVMRLRHVGKRATSRAQNPEPR